ncbi:MAG: phosphoadenosine phosphosulfate reductase family protein [bacterium]
MTAKRERHILALSGGKDSAALAVYMREKHPEIPLEYVFIDSGCELPETYEYLDRIRAVLSIEIISIRSPRGFEYWLKYYGGVLPSPTNRWCTRQLKLRPYKEWLRQHCRGTRVYSYVGLRADEDREGYRPSDENIIPVHPFIDNRLMIDDIIQILSDVGLGMPSYYSWRQRSGCFFCFFQRDNEWRGLRTNHPTLFEKACQYEEQHSDGRTYTWRDNGSLRDLSSTAGNGMPEAIKNRPLLIDSMAGINVQPFNPENLLIRDKK